MKQYMCKVVCNEKLLELYYDTNTELYFIGYSNILSDCVDSNLSLLLLFQNNDMDEEDYPELFVGDL